MHEVPIGEKVKYETLENTDDTTIVMLNVLNRPVLGGYQEQELVARIIRKVMAGRDSSAKTILLEDTEFNHLIEALKNFPYKMYDPAFFDWLKKIVTLPAIKVVPEK